MKKVITLILALVMVCALFAGCNGDGNSTDTTTAAPSTTPAPGTTTAAPETTTEAPETTTEAPKDTTTEAPKDTTTEAPTPEIPAVAQGMMVYYEDFDSFPNTADSAAVAQLLGWTIRNKADGALTDNTASYALENGVLKITNWNDGEVKSPADCYVQMTTSAYMAPACQGDYTVQFDLLYTAVQSNDRYITILENYDGCNSYNTFHLRAYGSAHLQARFFGEWKGTYDLKGSDFYSCDQDDSDGTSSIAKKLLGKDFDKDTAVLLNVPVTVRIQCSYNDGPIIWLRDNSKADAQFVCVAKMDVAANGAMFWNAIEEYALCLKVGGGIDGTVDNIAVWTGLGELPTDTSTTAYKSAIESYLATANK